MPRVCRTTKAPPEDCWCKDHCPEDERERRKNIGEAVWEWRGGEALHVFVPSKQGGHVSLCNLRHAQANPTGKEPTSRCDQCKRTLGSRTPNARMVRYLATKR